jgi:hypothetical protein
MATTTNGIYYPTSSDNIAPLESVFSTMATSIDTAVKKIESGTTTATTVGTTVGNANTVAITFASAFAAAPSIVGSVQMSATGSAYNVSFFGVSTTGCTAKITRVAGTSNDGNLFVNWIARN